jgi:PPOX class probable F420-dependent enzyme
MPKMTHDEALAFIAATPARTAKVATVLDDGSPHVAPVWVALDGDDILFNTGATTRKGRSLSRDPRISMCFDDETPPFAFVVVTGTVTLTEDPDELLHWATLIGGRYMGRSRRGVRASQRRARRAPGARHGVEGRRCPRPCRLSPTGSRLWLVRPARPSPGCR